MKKIFLIHRWDGRAEGDWYPWLKEQLISDVEFNILAMPNSSTPTIKEWVDFVRSQVGSVDNETYFIGHSIGCQTILRFLSTLKSEDKVGGVLLVTPWISLPDMSQEENDIARQWLQTPIDWEIIKNKSQNFTAIFSDNDPFVSIDQVEIFKNKLNAKIIIEKSKGHLTEDDGILQSQTILNEVKQMIN